MQPLQVAHLLMLPIYFSIYHSKFALSIIILSITKTKQFKIWTTCPKGHTTKKLEQLDSNIFFLPSWSLKKQFLYILDINTSHLWRGSIASTQGTLAFINQSYFDTFFPAYNSGFLELSHCIQLSKAKFF